MGGEDRRRKIGRAANQDLPKISFGLSLREEAIAFLV